MQLSSQWDDEAIRGLLRDGSTSISEAVILAKAPRIEAAAASLLRVLAIDRSRIYIDRSLNYSNSWRISFSLNSSCQIASLVEAAFEIAVFVSILFDVFTITVYQLRASDEDGIIGAFYEPIAPEDFPDQMVNSINLIIDSLNHDKYYFIYGDILNQKIDGYRTRLDKLPASLFDILFREI